MSHALAFVRDIGAELLFFVLCTALLGHALYGALIFLKTNLGKSYATASFFVTAVVGVGLLALPHAFGLTGLEAIEVKFIDDRNRALYFWAAGMWLGFALSFPFHARKLAALGIMRLI
jgi:hypothetical protein